MPQANSPQIDYLESELKLKKQEIEGLTKKVSDMAKLVSMRESDTKSMVERFQQSSKVIQNLKEERDRLLHVSNNLRAQLNYAEKQSKAYSVGVPEQDLLTPGPEAKLSSLQVKTTSDIGIQTNMDAPMEGVSLNSSTILDPASKQEMMDLEREANLL